MKIKIEDVVKWAKPHPVGGGKQTRIKSKNYTISIVGGRQGLYGDFENDFELAIFDGKNNFVTKYFKQSSDDVLAYLPAEEVEEIVDMVVGESDFQVL